MLLLLVLFAAVASLQLGNSYGIQTDDAPITWRYAENLATGHGFVYNDSERILGTSTPLFTLALAALRFVGLPVETAALLISLASFAAVFLLIVRLAAALGSTGAGLLAAGLVATEAPFLVYSTQGMETTAYVALILGAIVASVEGRERTAFVLAALAILMRLDGAAVGAALAVAAVARWRRPSWGAAALLVATIVPWFLFSWLTFGSLAPQSMLAKLAHTKYSEPYWMLRSLFPEGNLLFVPFGVIGALSLLLRPARPRAGREAAVPIAWFVCYVGAFSLIGIDAYPWYRIPIVPICALFAGFGIREILLVASRILALPGPSSLRWISPRARHALLIVALLLLVVPWGWYRYVTYHDSLVAYSEQLRVWERPRIASAEWLRDHATPGSTVRTSAVGHIGWISGLRVQDTSGLVSRIGPEDPAFSPADFIVGHDGDPVPGAIFKVDSPDYELVQSLAVEPTVVYRIYKRKGTALR